MTKKKVKDFPDLEKDTSNGAVINTNGNAFASRRKQMKLDKEKDSKITQLEKDVAELKKLVKGLSKK
jgi:hypothetical protein